MTSRITTSRTISGPRLTVGDFRALFAGVSDDVVPSIRVEDNDRFGPAHTHVTVNASGSEIQRGAEYGSADTYGSASAPRDFSEPFGQREATR